MAVSVYWCKHRLYTVDRKEYLMSIRRKQLLEVVKLSSEILVSVFKAR